MMWIAALLLSQPVLASDKPIPTPFTSIWDIVTQNVPNEIFVGKDNILLKLPVFPRDLVIVKNSVFIKDNSEELTPNENQFVLYTLYDGKKVYCSTRSSAILYRKIFKYASLGRNKYTCLLDSDGDDKLDSSYQVKTYVGLYGRLPILSSGQENQFTKILPVEYRKIDSDNFNRPLNFYLKWIAGDGFQKPDKLQAYLESEDGDVEFFDIKYPYLNRNNNKFSFIGLNFVVDENRSNIQKIFVSRAQKRKFYINAYYTIWSINEDIGAKSPYVN